MRTVTNKNIISMILLRTGTKSIRGLNYVRTVTKRLSPYLMKSEKGIIAQGPVPYDGREGMFLRLYIYEYIYSSIVKILLLFTVNGEFFFIICNYRSELFAL